MAEAGAAELELVRVFVNTLDVESGTEGIAGPDALADWLRDHDLIGPEVPASRDDLARAATLREALRAHLRANNGEELDPAAVSALEEQARRSGLQVELAAGTARVVTVAEGLDGAFGAILAAAATAMLEGTWPRLKACAAETCRWAFVDRSPNRSRHWCDMRVCGNREKVRAYRARQANR
jgi:predicted RNA-binding Zn ribbon-like protein